MDILEGKITSLLGPSGSGKTTLLRILAGLESSNKGNIKYKNKKILKKERHILRQNATLVFQKSVFFDTTVYNNIAFGLKLNEKISKQDIDKKINETLAFVGLEGYEKRKAKKLSGGEQQRVSLARALVLDRELLLLDEPTVNLDPKNVSIIEEIIQRVNREKNTTIVLATHNMFQAESVSQDVVLIVDGKIKQTGSKEKIFGGSNEHLTSFARLENVFSGSAIIEEGRSVIIINENLKIEASFCQSGDVSVHVRPEDILVSIEPLHSSARNAFKGTITGITDMGSILRLTVNTGKKFTVQVTRKSLVEMNLKVGSEIYLTFKASSVMLI